MTTGLTIQNLDVRFGALAIIDGLSLTVRPGRLTALVGPNGAGKSTLLKAVLGILRPQSGRVAFEGADLLVMPPGERARIAALAEQTATTEFRISARDVVMLGRLPFQPLWQTEPSARDRAVVEGTLRDVDMLELAERPFHSLSGGEQQRLHLARLFAQEPRLLLLDEPTNHLDPKAQLIVRDLLRAAAAEGRTVLVALHDLNLAAEFFDDVVVLEAGRLAGHGPIEDVLTPGLLQRVYGVEARIFTHPGTGRPLISFGSSGGVPAAEQVDGRAVQDGFRFHYEEQAS